MTGLYDIPLKTLEGDPATLAEHKGKTLLIVNVASRCGFTPQYEGLQAMYERYQDRGFEILGFPCNQFLGQEPGTSEDIREFCSTSYGVSFPLFRKLDVNGPDRHPVYEILTQLPDDKGVAGDVQWNFEKFLVSSTGEVVGRFRTMVKPEDPVLVEAVEKQLPE
jgi:glutathione peroxidase